MLPRAEEINHFLNANTEINTIKESNELMYKKAKDFLDAGDVTSAWKTILASIK